MSSTGSVRVPELTTPGKEVDCEIIERNGISYFKQKVISESADIAALLALQEADGSAGDRADTLGTLGKILKELRLMNLHLAAITGEKFTSNDI